MEGRPKGSSIKQTRIAGILSQSSGEGWIFTAFTAAKGAKFRHLVGSSYATTCSLQVNLTWEKMEKQNRGFMGTSKRWVGWDVVFWRVVFAKWIRNYSSHRENKLLLISIKFTLNISHSCLKKGTLGFPGTLFFDIFEVDVWTLRREHFHVLCFQTARNKQQTFINQDPSWFETYV